MVSALMRVGRHIGWPTRDWPVLGQPSAASRISRVRAALVDF